MGTLHYGTSESGIAMDDTTLAHLAAVTVAKLRRHEPFLLTCVSDATRDGIWLHTASTVRFEYASAGQIELDKARLEAMVKETNRPAGLVVRVEAQAAAPLLEALAVAA